MPAGGMASSASVARLRELAPAPGTKLSAAGAAALAECCGGLLRPGGGDAEAVRSALNALCAAGGGAMRRHADGLAPLVVGRLGDGDATVREAARRFLVLLMEMKEANARLENTEPNTSMINDQNAHCATIEMESSDTRQACHLLNFLSKELLRDFEPCAELLIPVLLKNVVITILVIADSADSCIKEMLRNCKVARILPKIIEFAKNDRSAVLRARYRKTSIWVVKVDSGTSFSSGDLQPLQKPCLQCDDMITEGPPESSKHDTSAIESSFEDRSILGNEGNKDTAIEKCDSDNTADIYSPGYGLPSANPLATESLSEMSLPDATVLTIVQDKAECKPDITETSQQVQVPEDPSKLMIMSPTVNMKGSGKLLKQSPAKVNSDASSPGSQQVGMRRVSTPKKSIASKGPHNSYTPNFRRPLLSKQMTNWFYASTRSDLDEKKLILGEMDKNNKLKEVAVAGFSSIYSHYDPASVLSFLVSMPMEEQKRLRWAMKQLIPTVETDLEEFLQQRRHKQRAPSFDTFTAKSPLHPAYQSAKSPLHPAYQSAKSPLHPAYQSAKSPLHPAYQSAKSPLHPAYQSSKSPLHPAYHSAKSPMHPAYQSNSVEGDDLFSSAPQCLPNISLELQEYSHGKIEPESSNESYGHKAEMVAKKSSTMNSRNCLLFGSDYGVVSENTDRSASRDQRNNKRFDELNTSEPSINFGNNEVMRNKSHDHEDAVSQFNEVSKTNGHCASTKMSSSLLEMLDDPDEATRELALSLLVEVLEKQRTAMEGCIETLIAKLLHATKDATLKVVNQAHICLTTVITQFDPLRCLRTIASQLACQDEKILLISINSLSKLVIRLSPENLMAHLSTFLPSLLDAFEDHSPYVRKAVMVCLVDTYLKLGPAVLPYLESLDSAALQLVTTYANRLSQARAIAVDG
ncbi:hypothetical protein PR202_ga03286 [Eleusine coracana subsp. coracana]|uniref:TOG domain-containing protein n=1 Tax=Eleusine coracana subsp. coracana TaxID=191504 RepID=A0AAV5BPH4_ELECO|nr:hypothetical protein PR202_ga03286 [Eleusine coracana subsp. coracana]